MRQIEHNMIHAVVQGHNWQRDNTRVRPTAGMTRVTLYGNCIAILRQNELILTLAGRPTPTTRSRLNALINAFADPVYGFTQRDHEQYFMGKSLNFHINADEAVRINDRGIYIYESVSQAEAYPPCYTQAETTA